MDINRRENESFLAWKFRLIRGKIENNIDVEWQKIVDVLGLKISSDHLRKTSYGVYECLKYFDTHILDKEDSITLT